MKLKIEKELIVILNNIISESKSKDEWAEIESDDMYQSENYIGGYDADEEAFCFSYYDSKRNEYWFQLTLDEVEQILLGKIDEINIRASE